MRRKKTNRANPIIEAFYLLSSLEQRLHGWDVSKKIYKNYYESWETVFMICLLIVYLMLLLFCLAYIADILVKYYYFIKIKNNPPWPLG